MVLLRRQLSKSEVPLAGLEPARGFPQQILNLLRLPFRHSDIANQECSPTIPKRVVGMANTASSTSHQFRFFLFKSALGGLFLHSQPCLIEVAETLRWQCDFTRPGFHRQKEVFPNGYDSDVHSIPFGLFADGS